MIAPGIVESILLAACAKRRVTFHLIGELACAESIFPGNCDKFSQVRDAADSSLELVKAAIVAIPFPELASRRFPNEIASFTGTW